MRGKVLAILGPDGSGKSSVVGQLEAAFPNVISYHIRPRVLPGRLGKVQASDAPHGRAAHNAALSVFKLVYFLVDYLLGYQVKVRWHLSRSAVIIFDRHYYDLFVDPKRYGYGGPRWLIGAVARLIPQPDAWFVLDVSIQTIRERKTELAPEEIARQRNAYRALLSVFPKGQIVDAERPLREVAAEIAAVISVDTVRGDLMRTTD